MLVRNQFEKNYRRLFSEYKYGTTIWSPLASGILSGKYNDGNVPEGSRLANHKEYAWVFAKYLNDKNKENTLKKLNALGALAKEVGYTQAQLAIAWAIANKDVSTCILGFTRIS